MKKFFSPSTFDFYFGAFCGAYVMLGTVTWLPEGVHWWTPLAWAGCWLLYGATRIAARIVIRKLIVRRQVRRIEKEIERAYHD